MPSPVFEIGLESNLPKIGRYTACRIVSVAMRLVLKCGDSEENRRTGSRISASVASGNTPPAPLREPAVLMSNQIAPAELFNWYGSKGAP